MFNKKYSPILLTKATMLVLHMFEQGVHFIFQEEMARTLQMTIDASTRKEPNTVGGGSFTFYHSDITASILCSSGKAVEVEAEIELQNRQDGEWVAKGGFKDYVFRFPNRNDLSGKRVYFSPDRFSPANPKIQDWHIWIPGILEECGKLSEDPPMCYLRKQLVSHT